MSSITKEQVYVKQEDYLIHQKIQCTTELSFPIPKRKYFFCCHGYSCRRSTYEPNYQFWSMPLCRSSKCDCSNLHLQDYQKEDFSKKQWIQLSKMETKISFKTLILVNLSSFHCFRRLDIQPFISRRPFTISSLNRTVNNTPNVISKACVSVSINPKV